MDVIDGLTQRCYKSKIVTHTRIAILSLNYSYDRYHLPLT